MIASALIGAPADARTAAWTKVMNADRFDLQ